MLRSTILTAALLISAISAPAQKSDSTWDVFGGVSVLRSSMVSDATEYHYGWTASVANRPYESHPWVGGVVEGTGIYNKVSGTYPLGNYRVTTTVHTALGGIVAEIPHGRVRPFAHVLVGGAFTDQVVVTTIKGVTDENDDYFANAIGGGVDLRIRRHVFIRTQADWMHIWQMPGNDDSLRLAGGVVLSY